jgi:hypothetical protein
MKVRRTRVNRALALWIGMFLLTVFLVAVPTEFKWGFWLYGLIWGTATSATHYVFRRFFEEDIDPSAPRK